MHVWDLKCRFSASDAAKEAQKHLYRQNDASLVLCGSTSFVSVYQQQLNLFDMSSLEGRAYQLVGEGLV